MEIKKISKEIHQNNIEKGFWEDKETKNVGEVLMLITSELAEALEAHRNGKNANVIEFKKQMNGYNVQDSPISFEANFQHYIKDSFEDELADVAIRLFDVCEGFNIDLAWHIRQKADYNKTRPFKHNKAY